MLAKKAISAHKGYSNSFKEFKTPQKWIDIFRVRTIEQYFSCLVVVSILVCRSVEVFVQQDHCLSDNETRARVAPSLLSLTQLSNLGGQ